MMRDTTNAEDTTDSDAETLTRNCDHCGWHTAAESYAEMVRAYQDHLRESHPKVWLQT